MSKKFLTPIEFVSLPSDPMGQAGAVYFNSSDKVLKYYDGTTWNPIGSGSGSTNAGDLDGGNAYSMYLTNIDGGGA